MRFIIWERRGGGIMTSVRFRLPPSTQSVGIARTCVQIFIDWELRIDVQ